MKIFKFLLLGMALLLTACGRFEVSIEPIYSPTATGIVQAPVSTATAILLPTEQVNPTATITIPSATPVPVTPAATQVPPVLPTSTPREQFIKIFLIELEDNGQAGTLVGCGDSVIPINVTIPPTQGILRAALEKLFSAKNQFYGESGYYNALYQSDLQVTEVTIQQGKATIHLTGSVVLGGVCDAPRVEAQIEQTALQFSTVNEVNVFINDVPLEDVLSLK
ncbi:MAG TPA: GerMN domain-containing protein [Anaerolineales bacterium]|nr:GerMN domain-containing protein [Anaerolineales bacterium]